MNVKNSLATVWWINCGLLAALVIWWFSLFNSHWQPPDPLIPDYSGVLDGAVLPGQLSADDYASITTKPLFEFNRSWPEPAPKAEEKVPEPEPETPPINALDGVVLQGIYDQADTGIAIFSVQGKSHRLKSGETYEDWTLESVDSLSARFSHPTHGEKVLKLKRGMTEEEKAAAAQAPPAPRASNASNQGTNRSSQRQNSQPSRAQAAAAARTVAPAASSASGAPRPVIPATIGGASIGGASTVPTPSK